MNFTYLKSIELPKGLYDACREAELFAKTFPAASLSSARRAGEFAVKMMYSALFDGQDSYGMTTFDMLSELSGRIRNTKWLDAAHKVRKSGNTASHQGKGNVEIALEVLAELYFEIGYSLKYLGLIEDYPSFDYSQVPETTDEPIPKTEIEIELTKEFVDKLRITKNRVDSIIASLPSMPIDLRSGTTKDSGANSKTALSQATQYLMDNMPDCTVYNELRQGIVYITNKTEKTIAVAVKSGCPPLGKRVRGVMEILPGIDYVAYAPSFSTEKTYIDQLRVFTKEEFLSMWSRLDLIRTKISTATYKRLKQELPPDASINKDKYADTISVQSFANSGRKTKLLNEELKRVPLLSQDGMRILRDSLENR